MGEDQKTITCTSCIRELPSDSRFCKYCGADQVKVENIVVRKDTVIALISFYVIEVIICSLVTFDDSFKGLDVLLVADGIMAASAICFCLYIRTDIFPFLKWKKFSLLKTAMYIGIAIAFSIPVQYSVKWLNSSLFDTNTFYYYAFLGFKYPLAWMLLVIAVAPAIFEELAYRGFVLGALLKLIDKKQAIFISSFVFALIHFSFLSFFWLLPFALLLGHIRSRENTIWYGVIMHFTFNAMSCLLEYYDLNLF
ncbi:MAG: CPBP family intramembrane glutamic endopeptidase [Ginsengibacter sp.]